MMMGVSHHALLWTRKSQNSAKNPISGASAAEANSVDAAVSVESSVGCETGSFSPSERVASSGVVGVMSFMLSDPREEVCEACI